MTDDEVKALAEKLGEYRLLIRQEGMVGITYKPLSDLLDKQIIEALARVALDDCEERKRKEFEENIAFLKEVRENARYFDAAKQKWLTYDEWAKRVFNVEGKEPK